MAPRGGRGGGGHSSGGGSSSVQCSSLAFQDSTTIVYFVDSVLFFVLFGLLLLFAPGFKKKCGTGKQLIGAPYLFSLFLTSIGFLLLLIATVIHECNTSNLDTYFSLLIAANILIYLGYWLLLFVYIYVLNIMFRERLGGSALIYKTICIAMVGILFALFCGVMGVQSYDYWTQSESGSSEGMVPLYHAEFQLTTALNVLVFLAILASGGLSLMTLFSLRSRQHPASGIIVWVGALIFCMLIAAIIAIVFSASSLQTLSSGSGLNIITSEALLYIENFFSFFSFMILLFIAKHMGWNHSAATPTTPYVSAAQTQQTQYAPPPPPQQQQQQQYAYNQANVPQQYYHQQAPVYNNGPGQIIK